MNTDQDDCEIDLLVDPAGIDRLSDILSTHGYLTERAWGHAPHIFFSSVDPATGQRLTIDVVTDLRYGRPIRVLRGASVAECLARRHRTQLGWSLAPDDEFNHLLLHCALDKGAISCRHSKRLQALAEILGKDPEEVRRFVRDERIVFWRLFAQSPLESAWRWISGVVARRLAPFLHALTGRGLVVALLGPDGAGKSTLAAGLTAAERRARRVYMGYGPSGGAGRAGVVNWLLRLARMPEHQVAGPLGVLLGALRFGSRCVLQFGRGLTVRMHRRLGRLVVLDRYVSEIEKRRGGMGARFRRRAIGALCPEPDLLIVLDAPAEVLHRRRPEHPIEELAARRDAYRTLSRSLAHSRLVDASASIERLRHEVTAQLCEVRRQPPRTRTP